MTSQPEDTQPDAPEEPCEHERLDERGRCTACGTWAVLTGQVPVGNPRRTRIS